MLSRRDESQIEYWLRRQRFADSGSLEVTPFPPNSLVPFQFARFELKDKLSPFGTALAWRLPWDDSKQDYTFDDTDTSNLILLQDISGSFGAARVTGSSPVKGGRGWAIHAMDRGTDDPGTDTWEIISLEAQLTPFELYDDVGPGSTDKYVWLLKSDLTRDTTTGSGTVKVSDQVLGDVRAWGSSHSGFSSGAKGFYIAGGNGKNQIVSIQRLAKCLSAKTTGTVAKTDSSFTVDHVAVLDDGQKPVSSDSDTLTIPNWAKWESNSGTKCLLIADGSGGWQFLQGACKGDT